VEDRLGEGIEVGEDLAALRAEGVGLIEDPRDPPLFIDRWQGNRQSLEIAWPIFFCVPPRPNACSRGRSFSR